MGSSPKTRTSAAATGDRELRQLKTDCAEGRPPARVVESGDDSYRRSEIARRLPSWIVPEEERDVSVFQISGRDATPRDILQAIDTESLPFFQTTRRVVLVRDCQLLAGKTDPEAEPLIRRVQEGLPSDLTLIVEAPTVDRRNKVCGALLAEGLVLNFEQSTKEADIAQFVAQRLKGAGVTADRAVIGAIVAVAPPDTGVLASEVRKLAAYAGDRREVTLEDVEAVVTRSRETIVFELTDALGRKDVQTAMARLRELLHQGHSAIGIVMLIASRLRLLLIARALLDAKLLPASLVSAERCDFRFKQQWSEVCATIKDQMPEDRAANLTLQHPFVVFKTIGEARRFTSDELSRGLMLAAEADLLLKSTTGTSDDDLLGDLVLSLCSRESLLAPPL